MPNQINAMQQLAYAGYDGPSPQLQSGSSVRHPHLDLLSPVVVQVEPGSIEDWRLLLKRLCLLVGNQGSTAIFMQNVHVLTAQYPALANLSSNLSWPEQGVMLQHRMHPLLPTTSGQAQQLLWRNSRQLLRRLLRVTLGISLLQRHYKSGSHRHG